MSVCHAVEKLPYIAWHAWAEKQAAKGLEQQQCPDCKLWFFPSEWKQHKRRSKP